jgi:hypothetical protein
MSRLLIPFAEPVLNPLLAMHGGIGRRNELRKAVSCSIRLAREKHLLADPVHSMSHSTEIAKISQSNSTLKPFIVFFQHCDGVNVRSISNQNEAGDFLVCVHHISTVGWGAHSLQRISIQIANAYALSEFSPQDRLRRRWSLQLRNVAS